MITKSDNRPTAVPTRNVFQLSRIGTDAGTWDQIQTLRNRVDASGCALAARAFTDGLTYVRQGNDEKASCAFAFADYYAKTAV